MQHIFLLTCFGGLIIRVASLPVISSVSKTNSPWTDCCKSTAVVTILSFDVSPIPLIGGSECHMTLISRLERGVYGGNVTVSLKFGYNIFLFEKTFDLCDLTAENGLKCPLKPDMVSLAFKTFVPTAFPPGRYFGSIIARDPYGEELMCIGLNLSLGV